MSQITLKKISVFIFITAFILLTSYTNASANIEMRNQLRELLIYVTNIDDFLSQEHSRLHRFATYIYDEPTSTIVELQAAIVALETIIRERGAGQPAINEGLYYRLDKIYDLIYEVAEKLLTIQVWQVGLLSFSMGISLITIIAVIWGRLT